MQSVKEVLCAANIIKKYKVVRCVSEKVQGDNERNSAVHVREAREREKERVM